MIPEVIVLALFAGLVAYNLHRLSGGSKQVVETRTNPQLAQAAAYAARLYSERKYLAAEKAYLAVLKHDHKNQNAYSRLGKIYLALKNYPDAIECSRIAAQLSPNAHSYFNLGTVFYENKNYIKAIAAFEKSLMFEPSAGRYAALARVQQKLSNWSRAVLALEKAVDLQPDQHYLHLLYEAYRLTQRPNDAARVQKRMIGLNASVPGSGRRPQTLS